MRFVTMILSIASLWVAGAYADIIGTADNFAVLAGSTVTNTGATTIGGALNVGVSPGTAVTGTSTLTLNGGVIDAANPTAVQAESDLTTAYDNLANLAITADLTVPDAGNLGGLVLPSGVYKFDSTAQLTGKLTLDAQNNPDAFWVFQIGSQLTTASASSVVFENVAGGATNMSLFWQVGSSAVLGTTTAFEGNIVALTSISLDTGATIGCGRALARNGEVSLQGNTLDTGCSVIGSPSSGNDLSGVAITSGAGGGTTLSPVPEPRTTPVLLGLCIVVLVVSQIKRIKAKTASQI